MQGKINKQSKEGTEVEVAQEEVILLQEIEIKLEYKEESEEPPTLLTQSGFGRF